MYKNKYRSGKAARQSAAQARAAASRALMIAARRTVPMANPRSGGYLGIENKFVDYEYDAAISQAVAGGEADPAAVLSLSAMAQGDGESQRDGRKCVLTSVQLSGYCELTPIFSAVGSDVGLAATVRLVLVQDTQTNGAQLNAEDVIKAPTDTDLNPVGFRNLQFSKRFRVLADKTIHLEPQTMRTETAVIDQAGVRKGFKIYKKLQVPVDHSGTTAAVSTITDNSLHLIAFTGANDSPIRLRYQSRVRFQG